MPKASRVLTLVALLMTGRAIAGGGVILQNDVCIITIGFYTAHFTAYQPRTSGNTEFCEYLPDLGESIFVLDYLHGSLKEVPVDFRIIRDVTGLGQFAKWEDIEKIDDIDEHTVFYAPPEIKPNATFRITHDFAEQGDYIGVVSAGHPTNDNVYYSVFPFRVGVSAFPWAYAGFGAAVILFAAYAAWTMRSGRGRGARP